jgi:hypothetical protein
MTAEEHANRARQIFEVMLKVSGATLGPLTDTDKQWIVWALGVAHEEELERARAEREPKS